MKKEEEGGGDNNGGFEDELGLDMADSEKKNSIAIEDEEEE